MYSGPASWPSRVGWDRRPGRYAGPMSGPRPGDQAPDVTLVSKAGRKVSLAVRWRRRPLVAVFLRHFG